MTAEIRIVALADSLSLPRSVEGDDYQMAIRWEETWPHRLQAALPKSEVINCGARSRTADSILGEDFREHILFKRPDILIIQVGIVDCSPRIFTKREKLLLNLPIIPHRVRGWIIQFRKKRRAEITKRDPLRKVYTPPRQFEECLQKFSQYLKKCSWPMKVLVLPILSDADVMERKSPGIQSNLVIYNGILEQFAMTVNGEWLQPFNFSEMTAAERASFFWEDGYHLSGKGHQALAEQLTKCILKRSHG